MGITTTIHATLPLDETRVYPALSSIVEYAGNERIFSNWNLDDGSTRRVISICFGGKSGAGKSSLVNHILRREIFESDAVWACTKKAQSIFLHAFSRDGVDYGVLLTDLPGVADGTSDGASYYKLYRQWFTACAAFVYLVRTDDRAFENDEVALEQMSRQRLWACVSQADRATPHREWDASRGLPGRDQQRTLDEKTVQVTAKLRIAPGRTVPVATPYDYGVGALLESVSQGLRASLSGRDARAPDRSYGIVKWFNGAYGFISQADGGGDVFFHRSDLVGGGPSRLTGGEGVDFDTAEGPKGLVARRVRVR